MASGPGQGAGLSHKQLGPGGAVHPGGECTVARPSWGARQSHKWLIPGAEVHPMRGGLPPLRALVGRVQAPLFTQVPTTESNPVHSFFRKEPGPGGID